MSRCGVMYVRCTRMQVYIKLQHDWFWSGIAGVQEQ